MLLDPEWYEPNVPNTWLREAPADGQPRNCATGPRYPTVALSFGSLRLSFELDCLHLLLHGELEVEVIVLGAVKTVEGELAIC